MIICSINGQSAYPLTSDTIKITLENPYIKDSGEYSYEISFPMNLPENRTIFGNVQRLNVKKKLPTYADCKLYVDNVLLITGKGTVMDITQDAVKLQIVGGKSRIKFDSTFEKHYIDEFTYFEQVLPTLNANSVLLLMKDGIDSRTVPLTNGIYVDAMTTTLVGYRGMFTFNTAYDETNSKLVNFRQLLAKSPIMLGTNGLQQIENAIALYNPAVQPNFLFILRKVLYIEGFEITRNDLNVEPYDRLYIANVFQTTNINEALPHWTVYHFLEEITKIFGVTFVFNDAEKTVEIISKNELLAGDVRSFECEDNFDSQYDEDGLSSSATDNLTYDLSDSSSRDWRECMSLTILNSYPQKEYSTLQEMIEAANSMEEKERRSTIFIVGDSMYVYGVYTSEDGTTESETYFEVGMFNPLVVDTTTEDTTELKIVPVATSEDDMPEKLNADDPKTDYTKLIPTLTNSRSDSVENMSEASDGSYYLSVQDAMEGNDNELEQSADSGVMSLFFQVSSETGRKQDPFCYTDWRQLIYCPTAYRKAEEPNSMSLSKIHTQSPTQIDKNNCITLKFLADEIPSAKDMFIFDGKKFIASKIEIEIVQGRRSKVMTGYFYEVN